jgi:GUN4-like
MVKRRTNNPQGKSLFGQTRGNVIKIGATVVTFIIGVGTFTDGLNKIPGVEIAKKDIQKRLDIHPISGPEYSEGVIGFDYTELRNKLKNKDFKAANQETFETMNRVREKSSDYSLGVEDINDFPCKDLKTINFLWEKYSDKRFGFEAQSRVWLEAGGKLGKFDEKVSEKFASLAGWKDGTVWISASSTNFQFDTNQPKGHLPRILKSTTPNIVPNIAARLKYCQQ